MLENFTVIKTTLLWGGGGGTLFPILPCCKKFGNSNILCQRLYLWKNEHKVSGHEKIQQEKSHWSIYNANLTFYHFNVTAFLIYITFKVVPRSFTKEFLF